MSNERSEHAQACTFVNDAVQSIVCETRRGVLLGATLIQGTLHTQTEERRRPEAGRRRMEYPSTRAREPASRCRLPGRRARRPDTRLRQQTSAAEETGTMRIPPS